MAIQLEELVVVNANRRKTVGPREQAGARGQTSAHLSSSRSRLVCIMVHKRDIKIMPSTLSDPQAVNDNWKHKRCSSLSPSQPCQLSFEVRTLSLLGRKLTSLRSNQQFTHSHPSISKYIVDTCPSAPSAVNHVSALPRSNYEKNPFDLVSVSA